MKKKNNKGQTLVEYILIISVITIIAISLVKNFGGYLTDSLTKTSCSLANETYVEGEKPGQAYCIKEGETEEEANPYYKDKK